MASLNERQQIPSSELTFTDEDLKELEKARKLPITFDSDCPETTPERALKFKRVNPPRKTGFSSPA